MDYLYISSSQNLDIFPNNLWYDFFVELPMELIFKEPRKCALLEFDVYPSMDLNINVFCDLIDNSCFEGQISPFLYKVTEIPAIVHYPQFHKVIYQSVKRFHIYLRTSFTNSIPTQSIQAVNMVLGFSQ